MVKQRSVGLCIVLSVITCGIYGLYWLVCLNNDANTVTGKPGTDGGRCCCSPLSPAAFMASTGPTRWARSWTRPVPSTAPPTGSLAILYLVLNLFGLSIVTWALIQSEINKYVPAA